VWEYFSLIEWKEASVGIRVSFRAAEYKAFNSAAQTLATIIGVAAKKGSGGKDTVCMIRLDSGRQITCKVSHLELGYSVRPEPMQATPSTLPPT
jgi:hypothetical protein